VRRESLSISPRLAKIMINLSEVKEGEKLLDSFCGIGVILSEALNYGIKVIGIDKDEKAIKGCRENLKWFGFNSKDFELIKGDSSNARFNFVDVMVSEPDFGETLKKLPSEDRAKEMIRRYDNIMTGVLNNVKKHIGGRIVFTSPYIKIISKKRIGCNLKELAEKSGLKLADGFPISEFRENQVVGRQIVVFEKN
jgi:tRNA G10  N-methylase Trm11